MVRLMVNLYSDTQTRPTPGMRRAMAEAEVGDEQRFEDPTVNALCARVAELLGFEAAVFLPSGTMCNEIAFRLHIRPGGDEAILHRTAHPIIAEAGGPAAFSGAVLHPLDTPGGTFTGEAARAHPRRRRRCAGGRAAAAHGRRAADERGRGLGRAGRRVRPRVRHGVDR